MKLSTLLFCCLASFSAFAGPHTLQRGESFATVAALYNIPVDSVRNANAGIAEYIGYTIEVPVNTLFYDLGDSDIFRMLRYSKGNSDKGYKKYKSTHDKQLTLHRSSQKQRAKNEQKIIEGYNEAMKYGSIDALYQLGRMKIHNAIYSNDDIPTFNQSINENINEFQQGIEYLQIAAVLGKHRNALIELAWACGHESSPIRNPYLCLSMLEFYANKFDYPVKDLICYMYENGYGVNKNLMQAYIYSPTAKLVDTNGSKTHKEKLLEEIESLPANSSTSIYGNGLDSKMMFSMALSYYNNDVMEPEGLYWLHRSARMDNADANWALASILKNGNYRNGTVGRSYEIEPQVMTFVEKAASNGKQEAKDYLTAYREQKKKEAEYERQLALERQRQKEEKKRRRQEMWANVIGTVVQTAAQVYVASENAKHMRNSSVNSYNPSALSIGQMSNAQWQAQNQLALQQIMQYTLNKTVADWNGTPMVPTDMSAVNLGTDMSPGSPLWMWNQQQEINRMQTQNARMSCEITAFYKRQADMITQQMMENPFQPIAGYVDIDGNYITAEMVSADKSDNSVNSRNGYEEIRAKNKEYYSERYGNKECHMCHGSGICSTCNGRGYDNNSFGVSGVHECPNCYIVNGKKTGKCSRCAGTGHVFGLK